MSLSIAAENMSTASVQQFCHLHPSFPSEAYPVPMPQSQTPGLDALAEGSQYALERLQSIREAQAGSDNSSRDPLVSGSDDNNNNGVDDNFSQRDALAEARSAIRKRTPPTSSSSGPVRRRISRACDQCNQLRTKCDGQNPCAHCIGW